MVFSLAFMQGNSIKSTEQDVNVQQIAYGATYASHGESGFWSTTSGIAQGACGGFIVCGITNCWNPGGWGAWLGAAVTAG